MELVIHFIALYKEWNFAFTEWCLSSVTINKSFVEYISRFAECTSILGAALNEPSVSRSVLDACQQQAKKHMVNFRLSILECPPVLLA
jgi:hypothetical protein